MAEEVQIEDGSFIPYSKLFQKKIVRTVALRDPWILAGLKARGFQWIRPRAVSFDESLRNPTVGCIAEVFVVRNWNCVKIDSAAGRKLIWRECHTAY
jgi:hypothetical protein